MWPLIRGYGLWVMLCLLVGGTLYFQNLYVKRVSAENEGFKALVLGKLEVIEGKTGQKMAQRPVAEVSASTLRGIIKPQLDSLKGEFKMDLKRIEQYQRVQTETNRQVKSALQKPRPGDTVRIFFYQDRWLTKTDTVRGDTLYSGVDFRNDVQILVRKGKREQPWKFWKKRPLVGEVFTGNPSTQINDFQILKVIDK